MEETKYKDNGKLKLDDYIVFDLVRKSRDGGGGLALGCVKELKPAWVREGDDLVEALSVDIFVKSMTIRCCVAYGCQESDSCERKNAFWKYLDEEVFQSSNLGSGLVLHFDGNLWAGEKLIPGDPRQQNRNGKLFEEFLSRHPHLTVVNSLSLCDGLITRSRFRNDKIEESVLDFFVVCKRVLPYVTKMVIDEDRKYILTNYEKVKRGEKASDSDHYTEYMDVSLNLIVEKPVRREIFNFMNKEAQEKFRLETSETSEFSNCFNNNLPVIEQIENWRTVLKSKCRKTFKKIRITKKKNVKPLNQNISKLIDERNFLKSKKENESIIECLNNKISELEAEENRNKIMKYFNAYSENPENINLQQMWKTLKNLWSKCGNSLTTAKQNHKGKIISGPNELKI